MDTKKNLETALHASMRSGDDLAKRTIRMVLSAIKNVEIDKQISLDEIAISAIIQKEIKSREEVILDAQKGNREDIIQANKAEIEFLQTLLPPQLSNDEVEKLCIEVIQELGANNKSDMGKVMKALVPKIQGRASNQVISQITSQLLDK